MEYTTQNIDNRRDVEKNEEKWVKQSKKVESKTWVKDAQSPSQEWKTGITKRYFV